MTSRRTMAIIGVGLAVVAGIAIVVWQWGGDREGAGPPDARLLERSPADTTPPTGYRIAGYDYFRYQPSGRPPREGDWIARATIVAPDTSRCIAYIAYGPMDRASATNHGVYLKRADLDRPACAGAVAGFSRATHQVLGVDPRHLKEVEGF